MLKEGQVCIFTNKGSWANSRLNGEKVTIKYISARQVTAIPLGCVVVDL